MIYQTEESDTEISLTVKVQNKEIDDFRMLLRRALNTLEPEKRPTWALDLSDHLEGMPRDT